MQMRAESFAPAPHSLQFRAEWAELNADVELQCHLMTNVEMEDTLRAGRIINQAAESVAMAQPMRKLR